MTLEPTGNQTFGPYFIIGLKHLCTDDFAPGASGTRVHIAGRVLDGDGNPVNDAAIEVWQANAHGKYAHPADTQDKPLERGFRGFGRIATDDAGRFAFTTIKPGPVPGPGGRTQAPHLAVIVGMRGLLKHLVTRIYFPDEPANADDPILALVPPERRGTLVARALGGNKFEWDVILQGEQETVFFDY